MIAVETRSKADLDDALSFLRNAQVQAAIVLRDAMFVSERRHIAELAIAMRLPTIGSQNSFCRGRRAHQLRKSTILKTTAALPTSSTRF